MATSSGFAQLLLTCRSGCCWWSNCCCCCGECPSNSSGRNSRNNSCNNSCNIYDCNSSCSTSSCCGRNVGWCGVIHPPLANLFRIHGCLSLRCSRLSFRLGCCQHCWHCCWHWAGRSPWQWCSGRGRCDHCGHFTFTCTPYWHRRFGSIGWCSGCGGCSCDRRSSSDSSNCGRYWCSSSNNCCNRCHTVNSSNCRWSQCCHCSSHLFD
mmetsp:Transcript_82562/g.181486  ORF Transcript_82562/g.181486 Transcript_82562/m.181486 type:complete len:208 (+) Transcript_82562:556-1179(+)